MNSSSTTLSSHKLLITSSFPRRRRTNHPTTRNPKVPSEPTINISFDLAEASSRASASLTRFLHSSNANLRRLLDSGSDAFHDLKTSVKLDPHRNRFVFSCRHSSIQFLMNVLLWGVVFVVAARVLMWARSWKGLGGFGDGWDPVKRRDRSLGGREVVVGSNTNTNRRRRVEGFRRFGSPLSEIGRGRESNVVVMKKKKKERSLPEWWPEESVGSKVEDEELQREAQRLVRAIVDDRVSGKDYRDDNIIQLRKLCRISGAKVSFGTANARDSFYRASVDFVLRTCSRVTQSTGAVQIDGEDARQFISGLADNIGIENIRAARIICAAVAARTRSCFLQSWAFVVQGKKFEALEELSKICRIYQTFPPEEYSPEMEMVASGLKKNFGIEQRKHLLTLFKEVSGSESQRPAEEALGLR